MINRGCSQIKTDVSDNHFCNTGSCAKLSTHDWMSNLPSGMLDSDIVEVRFKSTRKGFYRNVNNLDLKQGDFVAVESSPGHDIGIVSLTGELALKQLKRSKVKNDTEIKKIYRKAKSVDIEKWQQAIALEHSTMLKARKIAESLKLDMKIGDVEYQGDKTKAIFYYIADDRVDFRELIKVFADEFKVRIEMRQIGARQEAGRIGGLGSCGRELCCSTWMNSFVSVSTSAARYQELSLNPQKLAGQCGKLLCCLNYELDVYLDAQKDFPDLSIPLETDIGILHHQKSDFFRKILWYTLTQENDVTKMIPISVENVFQILEANKKGEKVKINTDNIITIDNSDNDEEYNKNQSYGKNNNKDFNNRNDKKNKNTVFKVIKKNKQ